MKIFKSVYTSVMRKPVCMDALDGALPGLLQYEAVNNTPSEASLLSAGDETYPNLLSLVPLVAILKHSRASALWSSVNIQSISGFSCAVIAIVYIGNDKAVNIFFISIFFLINVDFTPR